MGFTTLTHALDPIASGAPPDGVRLFVEGRKITVSWSGTADATGYNVKRSLISGGSYTVIGEVDAAAGDTFYVDDGLTAGTVYYYTVSADTPSGESADAPEVSAAATEQLFGTVIGTDGSFNSAGASRETVFDGSLRNFFDGPDSASWAGLDLGEGTAATISSIKYCPREDYADRMLGGRFQGSDTADFTAPTDLFTIVEQPAEGFLTEAPVSIETPFRYVRYLSPDGSYGNAAEVQFFGRIER